MSQLVKIVKTQRGMSAEDGGASTVQSNPGKFHPHSNMNVMRLQIGNVKRKKHKHSTSVTVITQCWQRKKNGGLDERRIEWKEKTQAKCWRYWKRAPDCFLWKRQDWNRGIQKKIHNFNNSVSKKQQQYITAE